jgi:DNA-binding response OmpR family regulator
MDVERWKRPQSSAHDRPLIIGISGRYKQASDRILAELSGFDHYLVKPYMPSDVLRLIAPLRYKLLK